MKLNVHCKMYEMVDKHQTPDQLDFLCLSIESANGFDLHQYVPIKSLSITHNFGGFTT